MNRLLNVRINLFLSRSLATRSRSNIRVKHKTKNVGNLDLNTNIDQNTQNTSKLFEAISELDTYNIYLKKFPNLVMVGPQSSGKTSVIEALCGRNFMPKKMDMATMKPFHITTIKSDRLKFKIRDTEVHSELEASDLVERLNINPNINKIDVQIWSPDVYNAFMIDLPGLFHVSSKKNKDLPKQIRELSEQYLQDMNNIPCVVTTASQDPATNQAIQLAVENNREADSIGIITKVDLAVEKLDTGKVESMLRQDDEHSTYNFGYGWVAVVLKHSKENQSGMTVQEKIEMEKEFFNKYPRFHPAGVETLRESISKIQYERIKTNIPALIGEIDAKIRDLKSSGSFLDEIMNDPKNKLAFRLKLMIEKLVGSSLERAEFENQLKNTFRKNICGYLNNKTTIIDDQVTDEEHGLKLSNSPSPANNYVDWGLVKFQHGLSPRVQPDDYKTDEFRELFSYGLISPILANEKTIKRAFNQESALLTTVPMVDLVLDDPLGKKRLQWNKGLRQYFNSLLVDDKILTLVYQITEKMILEYLYNDPEGCDAITRKFSEYIVHEIGSRTYEENIKFSIKAMINTEKRPLIPLVDICRHLAQMYPKRFDTWHLTKFGNLTGSEEHGKIMVDVYGPAFNEAYLRAVSDKLAENIYRNVAVNLLDNMVEKLLEMTIDMFNQENVIKEKNKVTEKITRLIELRKTIENFMGQ